MKREFEQLEEIKKDISNKQEVYETQQIRELRRTIKQLESQYQDALNQKEDAIKFSNQYKQIIAVKDSEISRLLQAMQDKNGQSGAKDDIIREKNLHIEAMLTKMDLMKKSLDEANLKYMDAQSVLDQMNSQDFAKQNMILKRQNLDLIEEKTLLKKYIDDLKQNMKVAMSNINSSHDHQQQTAIFSQLLENISQDNVKCKRIIEELQKRENQCQRKWNKLLSENLEI